jgi:poly(A) polymerase
MHRLTLPSGLHTLRQRYRDNGFDLRLVGGCVRERLRGVGAAHDIDLCTDANPDEQRALYRTYAVRHIETGRAHGTWSVLLDGTVYEISSLRSDNGGDQPTRPRFTREWAEDLARRDLTINAILMDFEGGVIDPQQGRADLAAGLVRFVGDADARIREDPLRILRWFRFHATIAQGRFVPHDTLTTKAIQRNRDGLATVSRERVWAEMRRILSEPQGRLALLQVILSGVAAAIDLPVPHLGDPAVSFYRLETAHRHTSDPVSLIAAYLGAPAHVAALASAWRWSTRDRRQALLIAGCIETDRTSPWPDPLAEAKRRVAISDVPAEWMAETLRVMGWPALAQEIVTWPSGFPLRGGDLVAAGITQGPALGDALDRLRRAWADSNYGLTRAALLRML